MIVLYSTGYHDLHKKWKADPHVFTVISNKKCTNENIPFT